MRKIIWFGLILCALSAPAAVARASAARQDERAASVYYREGTRYALRGRLEEAAAAFEQAVRLDPKNGDAYFSLGNVYSEQGRWADAVAAYRKAVSLRKKDGEAYNNLGIALARRGEYERAAGAFERAVEIFPDWAEPRYHLSIVYRRLGRDVAGQVAYREAIERRPDYAARPPRSFNSDVGAPRTEEAALRTSAPATPPRAVDPAPAAPGAGEAREDGAGANRARADVEEAEASPYELGLRHGRAGRYEEAVAALTEAVRLDRNHAAAYSALGAAYTRLGRWREAVDAYEHAVRLDPRDREAFEMLGRSYAKLRETAAAEGARAATSANASTSEASAPESAPPAPRADADPTAVYRVGPGDVLEVRLPGARASQPAVYKVSPTGLLDYPRLGRPLKVEGLTTDEVAAQLSAELKAGGANVTAPGISVGVSEYASHAIIVSGLVKEPGTKLLRREAIPLYVIVAHAQPLASAGQALVTSKATGRSAAVNLRDDAAMKRLVFPGDVVDVQPLPKQFYYVAGAVRQPGEKEFHLGLTLTQAVLAAGGAQPAGARSVTVTRQGEDGRLTTTSYNLREIEAGRVPDPALRPGDRLEVRR